MWLQKGYLRNCGGLRPNCWKCWGWIQGPHWGNEFESQKETSGGLAQWTWVADCSQRPHLVFSFHLFQRLWKFSVVRLESKFSIWWWCREHRKAFSQLARKSLLTLQTLFFSLIPSCQMGSFFSLKEALHVLKTDMYWTDACLKQTWTEWSGLHSLSFPPNLPYSCLSWAAIIQAAWPWPSRYSLRILLLLQDFLGQGHGTSQQQGWYSNHLWF